MSQKFHEVWIGQCDAAEGILDRFGPDDALSYVVGEKFIRFLDAATTHAEFEAEVPAFAARLRGMFEPHELRAFFEKPQDRDLAPDVEDTDAHEMVRAAEKLMLIERAKELLLPESRD